MLSIKSLTHVYGNGVRALDDVDLAVDKGMFGLLGPNGAGKETEAPLTGEIVDVGVFTAEPGKKSFSAKDVLYMKPQPVRSGVQTFTVTVDKKPLFAGVDPYNKRIDRNSDDNDIKVTAG